MDRKAWHAAIHGVTKSWTRVSDWTELNWTLYLCSRFLSREERRWHLLSAIWSWSFRLSLCRVPSNCALFFHMTYSHCFTPCPILGLPFPESPSHPDSVLSLLRHSPLSQRALSFTGSPASSLLCALPVLCPLQLQSYWKADTFLPSCLFSCVSALPRTQNRIALFFTFRTSPRTMSMIS